MNKTLYKIKNLSKNVTDGVHNTVIDDNDGNCYLLSCKNIKNSKICFDNGYRKINDETLKNLRKRSKLEMNDVLITSVGTIGEIGIIKENNPNYEFQRSVGIIKPNEKIINPKYLYYVMQSSTVQNSINASIKGGVQACLFIDDIKNIDIPLCDLPTQQHIVDTILYTLL